jgi:disulfide bond formation protein DsbB
MTYRMLFLFIGFICFGALSSAFIAQYVFHLDPCAFCIYERYPYAVGLFFALMALWKPVYSPFWKKALSLCFLIGAGITFYHVLVEHKLIDPPQSCVSKFDITDATTIADLEADMASQSRVVRCDVVPIRIFGLSLAEYNLLLSFVLVFICLKKNRK